MISKNEIKFLKSLNLLKFRNENNVFKVEGWRSLKEFLNSDYKLVSLYATSNWLDNNDISVLRIKKINERDLKYISSLKSPNQIIGVFEKKQPFIELSCFKNEIGVFLEDVKNPGNLGSIIRTCDWFGIKKIICSNDSVDVYNPKVIQSTMGSLSRVSVNYISTDLCLSQIKKNKIFSFVADLDGESVFNQVSISNGIIFFGNESKGVSNKIKKTFTDKITIPGNDNDCESLNLSVSFGIIISQLLKK
tara:strand:- start:164 stop:907 length:744 start_codon:yes stop_codon:yes gene_type:complete